MCVCASYCCCAVRASDELFGEVLCDCGSPQAVGGSGGGVRGAGLHPLRCERSPRGRALVRARVCDRPHSERPRAHRLRTQQTWAWRVENMAIERCMGIVRDDLPVLLSWKTRRQQFKQTRGGSGHIAPPWRRELLALSSRFCAHPICSFCLDFSMLAFALDFQWSNQKDRLCITRKKTGTELVRERAARSKKARVSGRTQRQRVSRW